MTQYFITAGVHLLVVLCHSLYYCSMTYHTVLAMPSILTLYNEKHIATTHGYVAAGLSQLWWWSLLMIILKTLQIP